MSPFLYHFTVPESMLDRLGHVHYRNFRDITEIAHEAFLRQYELDVENAIKKGVVLFMKSDPGEYRQELHVGDVVTVELVCVPNSITSIMFQATVMLGNVIAAEFIYKMVVMKLGTKNPMRISESPFSALFA